MDDILLKSLERGENILSTLKNFICENEKVFGNAYIEKSVYASLWKHIIQLISTTESSDIKIAALFTLKIFSRNKQNLNEVICASDIDVLVSTAGLTPEKGHKDKDSTSINYLVVSEAQKCLSNLIFNSRKVQEWCSNNQFLPGLIARLKCYKDEEIPHNVQWFDIRLLFLLSGVSTKTRTYIRRDCNGFMTFIELFEYILNCDWNSSDANSYKVLTKQQCDTCNESLKTLYNILHSLDRYHPTDEDDKCQLLVSILRKLLVSKVEPDGNREDLISNSVNLLLLLPPRFYEGLFQPSCQLHNASQVTSDVVSCDNEYEGKDMSAVSTILEFLRTRLNDGGRSMENLAPVLALMIELTVNNRTLRKYMRQRILPPLKDVTKRPEEGDDIRNKLCALMTSPIPQLKTTSADLLFILCKEKVGRLIKYAGYGNAAGFLASRGLMMGERTPSADYSSDSELSDTEEYELVKDQVNPVTGRIEPEHTSPLEGMTEEQKESEAMKLVNALDQLNRFNIIQPCIIGDDGRPRPLEHVNELLEKNDRQTNNQNNG